MYNKLCAFCVAGTSSGEGKTTVTLALLRALYIRGLKVQPFKCGPDYIDPMFHNIACHNKSRNLDCWMMGTENVKQSFRKATENADCAVVEGVMGMFDSSKPGSLNGSTAQVAAELNIPVLLTVNCSGMAGSIAALVKGYSEFYKRSNIVGVIANKVGSVNHAVILREALDIAGLPPLVGYLIKDAKWNLEERHLGLTPSSENVKSDEWFDSIAETAEKCFDIDKILEISLTEKIIPAKKVINNKKKKLAVAYDKAFNFYYEDNLDILQECGFELVKFSPLNDLLLPENIDGVYFGGGFPEMFAKELESNKSMIESINKYAESGGYIFAECGGFMYLTGCLTDCSGKVYKMCGLIPAVSKMESRLRSLGYREAVLCEDTFFGKAGTTVRGHEFHWSSTEFEEEVKPLYNVRGTRNKTWTEAGYCLNNICAGYIHIHFASNREAIKNWFDNS
ncbi:MAG TPA: cobyrinate a,c-diamide synthase [Victivallales bacterium]|nr:cobyrinate a,c-diamide synthase [Victivallales bacterium]